MVRSCRTGTALRHILAVLGECRARIDIGRRFRAWIISPENEKIDAYSNSPARAWLIAIIKALIAQEDQAQ